jgi:hypothetical protein
MSASLWPIGLVVADALGHDAVAGVGQRGVEGGARHAQRVGGHADAVLAQDSRITG